MTDDVYHAAFEKAKADLDLALERKAMAEMELEGATEAVAQMRRSVVVLATLCGENVEDSLGLTEGVRMVYKASGAEQWFSSKEVREAAETLGVSFADLKNPDASVLSVLNRLTAGGELVPGFRKLRAVAGLPERKEKVWKRKAPPGGAEAK